MAVYLTYMDFLAAHPEFDGSVTAEAAFKACGGDTDHGTLRTLVESGGLDMLDEILLLQRHGLSSAEILETINYDNPEHLTRRLVQVVMEIENTFIHEDNAEAMKNRLQELGYQRPVPAHS